MPENVSAPPVEAASPLAWVLHEPGELLCKLPDVQPRLASWDAKTSPAQQELQAYLDRVVEQVEPLLGDHTDLYLEMTIDVRARERLHKGYDLENYLYPLIYRLGHRRFVLARARKYVEAGAPQTAPQDERPRATIRIGRAHPRADTLNAGWQHIAVAMGPGPDKPEWKQKLQARVAAASPNTARGSLAVQIAWRTDESRNWSNLWKPTGDSLGPILGTPDAARPFSPNDDHIVDLRLHRNDMAAQGDLLQIGLWWRDEDDLPAVYGAPVTGEKEWVARKRFHQSWYRHHVLRAEFAVEPSHGNYLSETDAWEGRNFLTPEIAATARKRFPPKQDATGKNRLYGNMLSSQPMCFNLFAPLIDNSDLAESLLGFLLPGLPLEKIKVEIEASKLPDVLGDNTAFDAFITYESGGRPGFIGIETKYSERFTQRHFQHASDTYEMWAEHGQWWLPETMEKRNKPAIQQLWRNHMLALALSASDTDYGSGELIVIHAPNDPHMNKALSEYRQTLAEHTAPPRTLSLDKLIDGWRALSTDAATRAWLNAFHERYLNLGASEDAWKRYTNKL